MTQDNQQDGPREVGLLALQDRAFFEALLRDPRRAIESDDRLNVPDSGIRRVEQLIRQSTADADPGDALEAWDRYHREGLWEKERWRGGLW